LTGFVRVVGADVGPKLASPYGLDVDTNTDRVYVADYGAGLVQVFTTTGEYISHFPADDQKLKVFGDGFSPYDVQVVEGRIVVASNDGLYFFDTTGHVVSHWVGTSDGQNVRGPQFGQFNCPDSFTVDPSTGTYYVLAMNRRIVAIGSDGRWLWASARPILPGRSPSGSFRVASVRLDGASTSWTHRPTARDKSAISWFCPGSCNRSSADRIPDGSFSPTKSPSTLRIWRPWPAVRTTAWSSSPAHSIHRPGSRLRVRDGLYRREHVVDA
jgi:hypothetical protein